MTVKRHQVGFEIPVTEYFHRCAQDFYRYHADASKAQQVYLNSLAVQAVKYYLTCLGIEANLEQSESWNPVLQVLTNAADLWVKDLGRLDCRPVLPDQAIGALPSEVSDDRIGYIFVQMNRTLTEASLLGFLPTFQTQDISLEQLQSLELFPDYLGQLRQQRSIPTTVRVALQGWLADCLDAGWENLETLLEGWQSQALAFSFRTPLAIDLIKPATTGIKQGKFLTLGPQSEARVLFVVGIAPAPDDLDFNITVELYPTENQSYLPPALHLKVMDEDNTPVLQAEGRQSEGLEFQFSGEPGERFSVQISLAQTTITELFEI